MTTRHLSKGSKAPNLPLKDKVRLYGNRFCPYSQRVQLVLDAKNIPYETIYINLAAKPDWFYDKSPLGKVPALELENGDVLYESLIICDYLDEKYSQHNQLHSTDPLQKAKDKLLIEQFSKVIGTVYKLVANFGRSNFEDQEEVILEGLESFEFELNRRKGPFFKGDKPGMLDYMIWPWCERADMLKLFGNKLSLRKDKYKNLMQWRGLMAEDSAVKKTFLDTETHIKFLQSYRSGVPQYDLILAQ